MSVIQAMQRRTMTLPTVAGVGGARADASVTISTNNVDRYGDRVFPHGADLTAFRANPVLLFGHDLGSLPIGTVTEIAVTDDSLRASWRWLKDDEDATKVRNAWDQGVLRAASIGFLPTRWVPNQAGGNDILAWELLEVSIVPIPANRESVRLVTSLASRRAARRPMGGILLVDDSRTRGSVSASEVVGIIRSAFAAARRF